MDAVVVFGLSWEDENREIKGRRGGGQFIEGVAVKIAFPIRVPSPRGEAVGVETPAMATIDALFVAIAEFAPHRAGAGFEFSASPARSMAPEEDSRPKSFERKTMGLSRRLRPSAGKGGKGLSRLSRALVTSC